MDLLNRRLDSVLRSAIVEQCRESRERVREEREWGAPRIEVKNWGLYRRERERESVFVCFFFFLDGEIPWNGNE